MYIEPILCLLNKFCICLMAPCAEDTNDQSNQVRQQRSTACTQPQWMQAHSLRWSHGPSEVLGWFRAVELKPRSPDLHHHNLGVRLQILRPHPRPTELETLGVGPGILDSNKRSR